MKREYLYFVVSGVREFYINETSVSGPGEDVAGLTGLEADEDGRRGRREGDPSERWTPGDVRGRGTGESGRRLGAFGGSVTPGRGCWGACGRCPRPMEPPGAGWGRPTPPETIAALLGVIWSPLRVTRKTGEAAPPKKQQRGHGQASCLPPAAHTLARDVHRSPEAHVVACPETAEPMG